MLLLSNLFPKSIFKLWRYKGKIIALDTSIIMNQFRSAVPNLNLSLLGVFYRTLTFLEHDIKPVFVFDGDPPEQKRALLEKRAQSAGRSSAQRPHAGVSSQTKEFLRLLMLLGVPCVQAPSDAEAFCAQLVSSGVVDAVASEDMDTLAFGGTVLLRQLNAKRVSEVMEYSLPKLLEILQLTQKEFVDLCILLGCDYCDKITGLGPSRALKLIQQHRNIEDVMLNINTKTHRVPLGWQYQAARKLFLDSPRSELPHLQWSEPNEPELVNFLCQEKHLKLVFSRWCCVFGDQGGEGARADGEVPAETRPQKEGERGGKGKGGRQTDQFGPILSCDTEKTVCRSRRIRNQEATED
ncbi:probable flap endonuclease 1 homolog isoform X2 [Ictalurus punctatus]|uniref:Probable flap endonuclease 1 homolog isoform X2 n=1 Tax=Ictalurus punctatus TaxID=7998 RepID=A0A9F7RLF6_ICTPU|nr:probable flap endonuclease 1 homolog isoform X2 [Ictalurus punctatus]